MNRIFQVVGALGVLFAAQGQEPARPSFAQATAGRQEVPENLKAPAGEEVILVAQAKGVQIYVCRAGADQNFAWVLKAPEAELSDATEKKIAHHSAGPAWKHVDGSEVTGKVIAKQDAPKPDAAAAGGGKSRGRRDVEPRHDNPANSHAGRPATKSEYLRSLRERQGNAECLFGGLLLLRTGPIARAMRNAA